MVLMPASYSSGSDLISAAATLAFRGSTLGRLPVRPVRSHIENYWSASKSRQAEWRGSLLDWEAYRPSQFGRTRIDAWRKMRGLAEEILCSDVEIRVSQAVMRLPRNLPSDDLLTFVASVAIGHDDLRQRLLRLLARRQALSSRQAQGLDRLRRTTQRWTDMLLGYLAPSVDVKPLAFCWDDVLDFASSFHQGSREQRMVSESLLLEGIPNESGRLFSTLCPNPGLNYRIASNLLACLGSDLVDAIGRHGLLWQTRLFRNAEEATHWVRYLLNDDL